MTNVDCYVDPACPFAWATSRWLVGVSERRDVDVTLKQMSLAVLNAGRELETAQVERMDLSLRGGRLLAAAGDSHFAGLYSELGSRIHFQGSDLDLEVAQAALAECGLNSELAAAMDDPTYDRVVRAAHEASQQVLGERSGSPIVSFDGHAFFGPVLTAIPEAAAADQLFNAALVLGHSDMFSQLQRPRNGPPTFTQRD